MFRPRFGGGSGFPTGRRQPPSRPLGTERVLIQRFNEADMPDFGDLLAEPTGRDATVRTALQLRPWYPAVSREVHGTTVTADGQDRKVQPAEGSLTRPNSGARRLGIWNGLGTAEPAELREMVNALAHADIIIGGPEDAPSQ